METRFYVILISVILCNYEIVKSLFSVLFYFVLFCSTKETQSEQAHRVRLWHRPSFCWSTVNKHTFKEYAAIKPPSSIIFQYLQQFWDDRQHLWVTDVDGVVPVGFPLVADVAQVKDGWQQAEDPKQQFKKRLRDAALEKYCGTVCNC